MALAFEELIIAYSDKKGDINFIREASKGHQI
jgi:hypothetical protein